MFQISANLSEHEAISFAGTLKADEKYFVLQVTDNPKAVFSGRRKRFVVLRNVRKGEIVVGGWGRMVDPKLLRPV